MTRDNFLDWFNFVGFFLNLCVFFFLLGMGGSVFWPMFAMVCFTISSLALYFKR